MTNEQDMLWHCKELAELLKDCGDSRLLAIPQDGVVRVSSVAELPGTVIRMYDQSYLMQFAYIAVDGECDKSEDEIKQMLTAAVKNILTKIYKDVVEK